MNTGKLILKNITQRRGRFIFTLLGITIGMASFVALLSLSSSLHGEVTREAGNLGANLIITPKNWCAYDQISILTGERLPESIPYDVVETVSAINGITAIPYLSQKSAIQNSPVSVTGILPLEMKDFRRWNIAAGSYFSSPDERAVVIGSSLANQFALNVNDEVTIRGEPFPVRAILAATGSNDDTSVFLPLTVTQEIYDTKNYVSFIAVKVDDIAQTESYIAAILDVANVAVATDKQLLKSVLSLLGSVNMTLRLIAGVALIAAAFGIINTMMTAIYERRREIGILRAIGSKSSTIFKVFLLESGLYGLLGGLIGVIVGYSISYIAAPLISQNEFTTFLAGARSSVNIDPATIVAAILFSLFIAVISGLYPAWKAAKLTPVEAISYE